MVKKRLTLFSKIILSIAGIIFLIFVFKLLTGISHVTKEYVYISKIEKKLITDPGWYYLNPFKDYKKIEYPNIHNIFPIIIQTKEGKIYTSNIYVKTRYNMDKVYEVGKFNVININQDFVNSELLKISSKYTFEEINTIKREESIEKIKALLKTFIKDDSISIIYIAYTNPFKEVK